MSTFGRSTATRLQPMVANAPDPGHYEAYDHNTMGAHASAVGRRQSTGAFGGHSSRNMPWQGAGYGAAGDDAPVRSTFNSTPRSASPSAAFAGSRGRFDDGKEGTPGPGAYAPARTPLSPSTNRLNRSSSFGGRSKRFGVLKEDVNPAPGQFEAKPGAFASASKKASKGFGSRSSRTSPFAGSADANAAPPPGAYDAHAGHGAFPRSSSPRPAPTSAAFKSRSSRFDRPGTATGNAGPDPTAYDSHSYDTMAGNANRTFNKMSSRGGGGFGSSARRPDFGSANSGSTPRESTPGPGSYAEARSASPRQVRPSSAFASKTASHESYLRKTDSPATTAYDAYKNDGMGAQAAKSFNKHAGTGKFGSRAARPLDNAGRHEDTPALGSYAATDPSRPTIGAAAAHSSRGAPTAFSSTETRDTSKWTGAGRE